MDCTLHYLTSFGNSHKCKLFLFCLLYVAHDLVRLYIGTCIKVKEVILSQDDGSLRGIEK